MVDVNSTAQQAQENAVQQAQQWAQEARTQRETVLSILRYFGLPERDYEALHLIRRHLEGSHAKCPTCGAADVPEGYATARNFPGADEPGAYEARVKELAPEMGMPLAMARADMEATEAARATPAPQRHSSGAWECPMTGFPCPNNCERPCGVGVGRG